MKNKKILRKGLFLTLGLGVAVVAITAIAASCNNKNNGESAKQSNEDNSGESAKQSNKDNSGESAKQSNKDNSGESAKQSNKDKAAKYMKTKLNEILSKLSSSSNESAKLVLIPIVNRLFTQFAKQIDDTLKASGKADMTDEEYNAFVNALDASLIHIPYL